MGLSSAMQWWDEWKLRILVLCSLCVQFFLYFAAWVRLLPSLRRLRVLVWIAYIGGDALAVYALATIFNRQKHQDGSNNALEVIWAPVLLIHLGGQAAVTSYSLEDNELWKRHAITLVYQVAVALYVFCKWWSGEKKLLQAAVLLFVVGILRFSEKPWALKRASFNSIRSLRLSARRKKRSVPAWWTWCALDSVDVLSLSQKGEEEHQRNYSLEDYVKEAKKIVEETEIARESYKKEQFEIKSRSSAMEYVYMMLVDRSTQYSVRLKYLQSFLMLNDKYGHTRVRLWVGYLYAVLYTKTRLTTTCLVACSMLLLPLLALASLLLFAKSDKEGYNECDIRVTYILFSYTVVNEFLHFLLMPFKLWGEKNIARWQEMVSQHNIMSFCARKKQPTILLKLAAFNCLREYIYNHRYIWQVPAALQIEGLIRQYVKNWWKEYICDPATYRRFNNLRGQLTLRMHRQLGSLGWSLNLSFDESVVLWHIATDLCFHQRSTPSEDLRGDTIQRSREISNYMMYLLSIIPEMLMPGTRQDLFRNACEDLELLVPGVQEEPWSIDASTAQGILSKAAANGWNTPTQVGNAYRLAEALMELGHEERWRVIQGVWVEMLCYSASRCRGYLHAKRMGAGGEFLTNVWFLWSAMGMEIMGDRIHVSDQFLEEEGITDAFDLPI